MYWPDELLTPIVEETNRYARIVLPPRKPQVQEAPSAATAGARISCSHSNHNDDNVNIDGISNVDLASDTPLQLDNVYWVDIGALRSTVDTMAGHVLPRSIGSMSVKSGVPWNGTNRSIVVPATTKVHASPRDVTAPIAIASPDLPRVRTKGGTRWKDLTIIELRAWIGVPDLHGD